MATPPSPGASGAAFVFTDGYARHAGSGRSRQRVQLGRVCLFVDGTGRPSDSQGVRRCDVSAGARFGKGPRSARVLAVRVSAKSAHPDGASKFIEFALQDKYLAAFSNGIGLIPATDDGCPVVDNYKPGGPLACLRLSTRRVSSALSRRATS